MLALARAEVPLACALAAATEGPAHDPASWRREARRWLALRSVRAGRRIMTVRNRSGLIFGLFFCASERLHGVALLAVTGLRVIEPTDGDRALEVALVAIDRLGDEGGCAAAIIRADPASRVWGEVESGLERVGRRRGWRPHGVDWLRPGEAGLPVLPLPRGRVGPGLREMRQPGR